MNDGCDEYDPLKYFTLFAKSKVVEICGDWTQGRMEGVTSKSVHKTGLGSQRSDLQLSSPRVVCGLSLVLPELIISRHV